MENKINNSQVTNELEEMTKKWMSLERKTLKHIVSLHFRYGKIHCWKALFYCLLWMMISANWRMEIM